MASGARFSASRIPSTVRCDAATTTARARPRSAAAGSWCAQNPGTPGARGLVSPARVRPGQAPVAGGGALVVPPRRGAGPACQRDRYPGCTPGRSPPPRWRRAPRRSPPGRATKVLPEGSEQVLRGHQPAKRLRERLTVGCAQHDPAAVDNTEARKAPGVTHASGSRRVCPSSRASPWACCSSPRRS